jgi:hypothetical protein
MIVIKVELHSAITGRVKRLGTMMIANTGTGDKSRGTYMGEVYRADNPWPDCSPPRSKGRLRPPAFRAGTVTGHARKALPVWTLVRKMLEAMEY